MNPSPRPPVVLVADRTLSARYDVLFEGIFGTMQTTKAPAWFMRRFLAPPERTDAQGRAAAAPLGLRRIEASLLADGGLTGDDVVCTTPEALPGLLGPWTRLVGISSSDPLGRGMSNTTTSSFWAGRLYTAHWMDKLAGVIAEGKRRFGYRVLGGGAGAWQWAQDLAAARRHGLDVVYEGYFEPVGAALIRDMLSRPADFGDGEPLRVTSEQCGAALARPLRGPATLGVVELSRGCGNGCGFCAMAQRPMEHLDEDVILADVALNAGGGRGNIVSSSEDFFRYGGGPGGHVNFERLRGLLEAMRRIEGLRFMQIDHANVSSVMQFDDAQLRHIRRLLTWPARTDYLWVNLGVESANGELVRAVGPGKIAPFETDQWESLVRQAVERMSAAGYFCVLSLVLGLPGERENDVARTHELVRWLGTRRAVVFPVFHEPVRADARERGEAFGVEQMRPDHLALLRECYEINFRLVPLLYWDNQRAGGVGWLKRAIVQALGRLETRAWRRKFARLGRRLDRAAASRGAGGHGIQS